MRWVFVFLVVFLCLGVLAMRGEEVGSGSVQTNDNGLVVKENSETGLIHVWNDWTLNVIDEAKNAGKNIVIKAKGLVEVEGGDIVIDDKWRGGEYEQIIEESIVNPLRKIVSEKGLGKEFGENINYATAGIMPDKALSEDRWYKDGTIFYTTDGKKWYVGTNEKLSPDVAEKLGNLASDIVGDMKGKYAPSEIAGNMMSEVESLEKICVDIKVDANPRNLQKGYDLVSDYGFKKEEVSKNLMDGYDDLLKIEEGGFGVRVINRENLEAAEELKGKGFPVNEKNVEATADLKREELDVNEENLEAAKDLKAVGMEVNEKDLDSAKGLRNAGKGVHEGSVAEMEEMMEKCGMKAEDVDVGSYGECETCIAEVVDEGGDDYGKCGERENPS